MKGPAALVVGILVLAGILWLALGGGTPPVPAGPGGAGEKARTAAPQTSPRVPAPSQVPGKATPPRRKKVETARAAAAKPKNAWKVLVVEKATGKPVPGAEVLVLDLPAVKGLEKFRAAWALGGLGSIERLFREFGRAYQADSQGIAWIAPILYGNPTGYILAAHKEDQWGLLKDRGRPAPPLEVEISPVPEIRVQVKDRDGNPVEGVPLGAGTSLGGFRYLPMRGVTRGPLGIARFRHIGLLFPGGVGHPTGAVCLLVPLKRPVLKEFDPGSLPRNPLLLTLPPTGRVEVYVQGPKGPVKDGEALVTISPCGNPGALGSPLFPPRLRNPVVPVKGGKAVFPFVGLGLTLQVAAAKVSSPDARGEGKPSMVKGPGPLEPGQNVTFRLKLSEKATLLVGRALLPSGKPAKKMAMKWKLRYREKEGGFDLDGFLRTDQKGRFSLYIQGGKFTGTGRALSLTPLARGKTRMEGKADLARDLPSGPFDLGDILLEISPLLAGGKVTDPSGRPIPNTEIYIYEGNRPNPAFDDNPLHNPQYLLKTTTDPSGNFRAYKKTSSRELTILAGKRGWFQEKPLVVPPGSADLRVVLQKGGTLRATFLTDPGIPLERLDIRLILQSEGKKGERVLFPEIRGNRALWEGLLPGTARVEVRLPSGGKTLAEIEDITVEAGREAGDPRLKKVDLRGKIRLLTLDLVDKEGKPVPSAIVLWGAGIPRMVVYHQGIPLLLPRKGTGKLTIKAMGFKDKRIEVTRSRMKVVLERSLRVRLIYTGEAPLPDPPFFLGVTLRPLPKDKSPQSLMESMLRSSPTRYFGKDQALETLVPTPGTYLVVWELKKGNQGVWTSRTFRSSQKTTVRVSNLPGLQALHVSLSAKDLEKALQNWGKE